MDQAELFYLFHTQLAPDFPAQMDQIADLRAINYPATFPSRLHLNE